MYSSSTLRVRMITKRLAPSADLSIESKYIKHLEQDLAE